MPTYKGWPAYGGKWNRMQITPDQKKRILDALGKEATEEDFRGLYLLLLLMMQRAFDELERPRPRKSEDREKLKKIGVLAENLARELELVDMSAWWRLRSRFHRPDVEAAYPLEKSSIHLDDMIQILKRLDQATAIHVPRGRPPNTWAKTLVPNLGAFWAGIHGAFPRRTVDVETGKEVGRFVAFVKACLEVFPPECRPKKFPERAIREYCTIAAKWDSEPEPESEPVPLDGQKAEPGAEDPDTEETPDSQ